MKLSLSVVALSVSVALAAERPVDAVAAQRYDSGDVMAKMMAKKEATWNRFRGLGFFKRGRYRTTNTYSACNQDFVTLKTKSYSEKFACKNLDVTGHLVHGDLGSTDESGEVGT